MKVASIDVGTNSVRLLLTAFVEGRFQNSIKKLSMTRLGKGVNETGLLEFDRMQETVHAISVFKEEAEKYGAETVYIMATSAVRDAQNSNVFQDWVAKETGLVIDVISGETEAIVGFEGVLSSANVRGVKLVIDIGGGSTELIVGDERGVLSAQSYNMGAVRMTGAYIHSDPISTVDQMKLQHSVNEMVKKAIEGLKGYELNEVIGIGGTAATFATMDLGTPIYERAVVQGHKTALSSIKNLNGLLGVKSVEERKLIPGLEAKRADIIYAGGVILEALLTSIGVDKITFSDSDNLEGYILYKNKKNTL